MCVGLAALWWGGLSALSFVAVPTLLAQLGAPVAGPVAAKLFSLQAWAALLIGLALLLLLRLARGDALQSLVGDALDTDRAAAMPQVIATMGLVLAAMVLALVQEFGVAQNIVKARASGGDLRLWHSLGGLMVLGQWLCASAVLWLLSK